MERMCLIYIDIVLPDDVIGVQIIVHGDQFDMAMKILNELSEKLKADLNSTTTNEFPGCYYDALNKGEVDFFIISIDNEFTNKNIGFVVVDLDQ